MFHLKQEQIKPSTFAEQVDVQEELFKDIKRLLEILALSVGCAQRALNALRCVLVMSSDWDFGVEMNETSNVSESLRSGGHDAFIGRNQGFPAVYSETGITETLDFLGLLLTKDLLTTFDSDKL